MSVCDRKIEGLVGDVEVVVAYLSFTVVTSSKSERNLKIIKFHPNSPLKPEEEILKFEQQKTAQNVIKPILITKYPDPEGQKAIYKMRSVDFNMREFDIGLDKVFQPNFSSEPKFLKFNSSQGFTILIAESQPDPSTSALNCVGLVFHNTSDPQLRFEPLFGQI